jgi:hypothetical protein
MVGTPALQVAQKVGVMNDAGEVGVLVIDAEGEEVPAIVNLTIKGNALRTIHRKIHRCGGVVLSSDFPATPSPCASRIGPDCSGNGSFEDTLDFQLVKQNEVETQSRKLQLPTDGTQTHSNQFSRTTVQLKNDGGIFVVPVEINGAITLDFVVDSGASDVSLPADVVSTLIRTGTIGAADFV